MTAATYDPALLPASGASVRCAAHAESIGLDPGGSALWVDELIVVDVPLPWPKPVWAADGFTAVPEMVMAAEDHGRRVRVLAAVALDDDVTRIVTHTRVDGGPMRRVEHHVEADGVGDLLATLVTSGPSAGKETEVDVAAPNRELLVCTQGSHDVCCGSRGTALTEAVETARPELAVRRVSHTGGHRMAPTGVTLPDGRMWGMVDVDELAAILDRDGSPSALAHRCRGWTGAPTGPGQVAERAVFAHLDDWTLDDEPRQVAVTGERDGRVEVRVDTSRGVWLAVVEPGRAVPTIACGEPGGLPAKPGSEWVVSELRRWRP